MPLLSCGLFCIFILYPTYTRDLGKEIFLIFIIVSKSEESLFRDLSAENSAIVLIDEKAALFPKIRSYGIVQYRAIFTIILYLYTPLNLFSPYRPSAQTFPCPITALGFYFPCADRKVAVIRRCAGAISNDLNISCRIQLFQIRTAHEVRNIIHTPVYMLKAEKSVGPYNVQKRAECSSDFHFDLFFIF